MNNPWWLTTFFETDPGIKPFYEDGSVVLFNCDCRLLLPHQKRYDLLLTDFPYGQKYLSAHRIQQFDEIVGDEKADYETLTKLVELANVAAYTFCRWNNLMEFPQHLKPKSFITWIKQNHGSGDLLHEYGRRTESIAFWPKEMHKWKMAGQLM
jgi:hypothetical protein